MFLLPADFWLTLPAKHQANFLMPFAIAILYFSPEVIQFCGQTYMEMLEYSNAGLAECPVMCPLCAVRGLKAERSQHLMSSEFIWTVSHHEGDQN